MNKEQRNAQREAEMAMGRLYNARNATVGFGEDMAKKGIKFKSFFYADSEERKRLPPDQWRVQVGDEILTMEQYLAVLMLMGYIK